MAKSSKKSSSSPQAPYPLSEDVKNQIVARRQAGERSTSIAALYGVTSSTVLRLEKKYRVRGTVENRWKTSGRPIYSEHDKRHVVRESRKNAECLRRPLDELGQLVGAGMSRWTVKRVLEKHDIRQPKQPKHEHQALLRPRLTDRHRAARLAFAEEHKDWTWSQWSRVVWTGEWIVPKSRSQLSLEGRSESIESPTSSGQVGPMVWGCFRGTNLGPVLHVEGPSFKSSDYIKLVEEHALDWSRQQPDALWLQDNAPIHRSKETTLALQSFGLAPVKWPAQSTDLNPIENIWSLLNAKFDEEHSALRNGPGDHPTTVFEATKREWEAISPEYLRSLVESMPTRMQLVIENKGGTIGF